jgi:hypothetical protein
MMGYNRGPDWALFEKHVAPLIETGWSIIEMGPGKVRRSLVRQFAEERGCKYHFADRQNPSPEHPGHIPMKSDFAIGTFCNRFDAAIDGIDCLFDEAGLETVVNLMENIDKRELARKHQIGNALPVYLAAVGRKA